MAVVSYACKAAKVDKATVYRHRKACPAFAAAWKLARETATDAIEKEAIRRAVKGVREPVYQGGKLVGHVRRYADGLLSRLLIANRKKFREKVVNHRHAGAVDISVTHDLAADIAAYADVFRDVLASGGVRQVHCNGQAEPVDSGLSP